MQDTPSLSIWFADSGEKEHMYRGWRYLDDTGYVEKILTINHDAIFYRPLKYMEQWLGTFHSYEWIVSIPPYHVSILPMIAASYLGKETVFFTSYTNWESSAVGQSPRGIRRAWKSYLRDESTQIVTVTEYAQSSLQNFSDVESTVIPHACNTEVFEPKDDIGNGGSFTVVFVGRIEEQKGIELLLRIASQLPDIDFRICGSGPLESDVETAACEHKNIHFEGFVDDTSLLVQLYNRADVLVLPSKRDGEWVEYFGVVLIEAMACGTPVVASAHPGPRSIVTPETGFLIPEDDEEEFKSTISYLSRNEEELAKMGSAARERVVSRFDLREVAQKWKTLLEQ